MDHDSGRVYSTSSVTNAVDADIAGSSVQVGVVHGGVHLHVAAGGGTGTGQVPDQRPRPPRHFIDRAEETANFREIIAEDRGAPSVVVISGAGGVGKSALAAHWAQICHDDYPDGALYADLGAFSLREPMSVTQALESFLHALGCAPEVIPTGLDRLAALYRDVTAGKRLTIFLDDAVSAAQVRPLIPASGTVVVVVTSRYRLSGLGMQGAHFVALAPMRRAESLRLLSGMLGEQRVQRERDAAEQMAELCAGLPVALVVGASRLATHRTWSLQRIAAVLADERRRLPSLALRGDVSVQAVFDLSYQRLPSDQAELYQVLSYHPGTTFAAEVAAAAVGRPIEETVDLLDALVEASLLNEIDENRFRFHDLLLLHAREHANSEIPQGQRAELVRRMVTWYLDCAAGADQLVTPGRWYVSTREPCGELPFTTASAALDWMELERENLLLAQQEAVRRNWPDLTWKFGEATWSLFVYRKHYRTWIRTTELAIDAARAQEHYQAESRLRGQLGQALLNLHRFDDAGHELEVAARLAGEAGDVRGHATAISRLGLLARQRGDLGEALRHFHRSLELDQRSDDQRGAALRTRRIGETLSDMGRYDEAITALSRAAELMIEIPDAGGAARVSTFLGKTYVQAGRPAEAVTALREALQVMREVGSDFYIAELLVALADAYELTSDLPQTRDCLWQACDLYERLGGPHAEPIRQRLSRFQSQQIGGTAGDGD